MDITMIVALGDKTHVIGKNGELPWPFLAKDLANFKERTLGKPCIMGRKTAESIMARLGKRRLLPDRTNIVLTRGCRLYDHPNAYCVESVNEALLYAKEHANGQNEAMIIGGAEIYKLFFPYATRMIITIVYGDYEGDTYFPRWDEGTWMNLEEETRAFPPENSTPGFRIETYKRVGKPALAI